MLPQIDDNVDGLVAKLDLSHARFSFLENDKVFYPNWCAPEGMDT